VNADGTVPFGTNLLKTMMAGKDNRDVAVTAVCAHDFGHVLQFKHKLDQQLRAGQPTVKRVELQAGYFAGYYAGLRKRAYPNYAAAVFAMIQFNQGDNRTTFEGHHGTPQERGDLVSNGFEAAYRRGLSLGEAIAEGTRYVVALR